MDSAHREDRARHNAFNLGLAVRKSRHRLPELRERYGGYMLIDRETNSIVAGAHPTAFSLSLEELESELMARSDTQ